MIRLVFRVLIAVIIIVAILFGGLLAFSTITDYQPTAESVELLGIDGDSEKGMAPDTLRFLIWNIGYAGLGAEMDFFNDGGKGTRPSKELAEKYMAGIIQFIRNQQDSTDFILLQEVDRNSKRSYEVDQVQEILNVSKDYSSMFALNYDVKFVPVPFGFPYTPYGKTYGGLQTLSKYLPKSASRLQYPGGFNWPTKLYMLDRCALEMEMELSSGRKLLVVNTHNTAYDASGEIKKIEMEYIKMRYENAVKEGKRVILGGDWNQVPPGWDSKHFSAEMPEGYTPQALDNTMIPSGFAVHFDPLMATNRSNDKVYSEGSTYTTLIDYFMTSANVEVLRVQGINESFSFSDHQPVRLTVVVH
jgi:endonuclease/exonuclease/phosphatase family metal-dependent hydrolase